MARFRDWAVEQGIIPAPIDGNWGRRWQQAIGLLGDGFAEGAQQATRARWIATCPDDALAYHGKARDWEQAPGETAAEYRARLLETWHLAEWAGTATGIIDALATLGLTNVDVLEAFTPGWGRHKSAGVIVPERARWVNVIVRHPHPFGTDFNFRYGDGTTYGSGKIYGPNGDPRWFPLLRKLVLKQKSKHSIVEWVAIVLAGDVLHANAATDGNPNGSSARVAYLPISL